MLVVVAAVLNALVTAVLAVLVLANGVLGKVCVLFGGAIAVVSS